MPALRVPAELPAVASTPSIHYLQQRDQVLRRGFDQGGAKEPLSLAGMVCGCMAIVICVALGPAWYIARKNKKKMVPGRQDEDTGMAMRILQL
ncbi:hypothetical protein FLAG1_05271 [Fusarium langsethiae]|uniref:Uncharacterized protein n=1 Tax=Fusarium langsethiae TaxID=179993 RepID=A0A0N0DEZ9_FUSLA|nr:hypothetical protein FLAG1_05271 [Fusarium langsethiae]